MSTVAAPPAVPAVALVGWTAVRPTASAALLLGVPPSFVPVAAGAGA